MKMKELIKLEGEIEVVTGLHIGAGKDNIEIGGLDLPVIKDPRTDKPYIPGSSLKGKMRFLTEWKHGKVNMDTGDVHDKGCKDPECFICTVFGNTEKDSKRGPTRLIVRDAHLKLEHDDVFDPEKFLEVKYENTINRITGTAKNPRPIERVTPGSKFIFEIVFRVFDMDGDEGKKDRDRFKELLKALKAVENDTRWFRVAGSGKIRFLDMKISEGGAIKGEYKTVDNLIAG